MLREILWFLVILLVAAGLLLQLLAQSLHEFDTSRSSGEVYSTVVRRDNLNNASQTVLLAAIAIALSPTLASVVD